MNPNSEALDAQQDLAAFLRQQTDHIVSEWGEAASKLDSAAHIPRTQLVNFIPRLLQHIAELAEESATTHGAELSTEASERHALDRLEDGFDLNEVVAELSMLRDCILRLWRQSDRTLRVLDRISSTALEAPGLDELLGHLAGAFAEEMTSVDTVAILLCEGDLLKVRASSGLPDSPGFSTRVGEGFAGTIASTRQPMQTAPAAHRTAPTPSDC